MQYATNNVSNIHWDYNRNQNIL